MGVSVKLDISEFEKRLEKALKQFPEAGKTCVERACLVVEAKAKENTPVDWGTLRSSISHKVDTSKGSAEGYIFTGEEYAPYVELGTGIYADDGRGRQTPWVYYDDKTDKFYKNVGQQPKKMISNAMVSEQGKVLNEFRRFLDYVR